MFKKKLLRLIEEYGVKREVIIETMESNRVTFAKKLKDNSFSDDEKDSIYRKYGGLM
jgi:hypothetical protein